MSGTFRAYTHLPRPFHICKVFCEQSTNVNVHLRKSTFFNVLTKSQAAAENFPFCTIDPNESRVPVPDERYDFLCKYHKPARCVHINSFCREHPDAGLTDSPACLTVRFQLF